VTLTQSTDLGPVFTQSSPPQESVSNGLSSTGTVTSSGPLTVPSNGPTGSPKEAVAASFSNGLSIGVLIFAFFVVGLIV